MNDWRKTSKGKPSKKWISYLRKAAKIQKDIQLKKDKDKASKELTKLQYKSVLRDIKDYSKGSFSQKWRYTSILDIEDFIIKGVSRVLFIKSERKPKTKTKTVKPKTRKTVKTKWSKTFLVPIPQKPKKKKTVKKTKTPKKTKSKKKKTTSKKKK